MKQCLKHQQQLIQTTTILVLSVYLRFWHTVVSQTNTAKARFQFAMCSKVWAWHVNYLINHEFQYFGMQIFVIPYRSIGMNIDFD